MLLSEIKKAPTIVAPFKFSEDGFASTYEYQFGSLKQSFDNIDQTHESLKSFEAKDWHLSEFCNRQKIFFVWRPEKIRFTYKHGLDSINRRVSGQPISDDQISTVEGIFELLEDDNGEIPDDYFLYSLVIGNYVGLMHKPKSDVLFDIEDRQVTIVVYKKNDKKGIIVKQDGSIVHSKEGVEVDPRGLWVGSYK